MASRFVKPDVTRLTISGGDYIDVKKRLNTGEQRKMFARMAAHMVPGEPMKLDTEQVGMTKVLEYLIGWSFADDGKPVAYRPDMPLEARRDLLHELDPKSFAEILNAIETHEDAQDALRESEKNSPDGASGSPALSPSPSITAGATNG